MPARPPDRAGGKGLTGLVWVAHRRVPRRRRPALDSVCSRGPPRRAALIDDGDGAAGGVLMTVTLVGAIFVIPGLWAGGLLGTSPGKRAMKIAVVGFDGRQIGAWRGLLRQLVLLLGGALFYIGWLAALSSPRRQAWHDDAAKSLVVKQSFVASPVPEGSTRRRDRNGAELQRMWVPDRSRWSLHGLRREGRLGARCDDARHERHEPGRDQARARVLLAENRAASRGGHHRRARGGRHHRAERGRGADRERGGNGADRADRERRADRADRAERTLRADREERVLRPERELGIRRLGAFTFTRSLSPAIIERVDVAGPDQTSLPIAVFDSGVGGLTVLHECLVSLPEEDYVYLGDDARFPVRREDRRRAARVRRAQHARTCSTGARS